MSALAHLPRRWHGPGGPDALLEAVSGVLATPPCPADPQGPLLFAAIGTVDVPAYLLAAKSAAQAIGRGRFAVLDDGTLTGEDRALLAHHCADPQIIAGRADNAPFPSTLAWQGLIALLGRYEPSYRILLDLSRVTPSVPEEVSEAIGRNRGFRGPGSDGLVGIPAMGGNPGDAALMLPRLAATHLDRGEGARTLATMLVDNGVGAAVLEAPAGTGLTEDSAREAVSVLLA